MQRPAAPTQRLAGCQDPSGLGPCTALLCSVLLPHCTTRMSHTNTFHVPSPFHALRLCRLAFVDAPFSVLVALQR